jgi:regulator of sigma E protease
MFLSMFSSFGNAVLLAFGFGFVIFWHEMGHFLAAKWADVKVEQFAVGFGQAMLSWRKGLGLRWGSSQEEFQSRLKSHVDNTLAGQQQLKDNSLPTEAQLFAAAKELNISETEYRLNWIPLGGYVKMLGQDDLKPGQTVSDPRSYNNKSVGKRMVIVSAGVIMNVILAAIGFVYIFSVGMKVPQPLVGGVIPGAPAQMTYRIDKDGKHVISPLQVGDTIIRLNGKWQSDWEKIKLNTMLLIPGEAIPIQVRRRNDGSLEDLIVVPNKPTPDTEFPLMGIEQARVLKISPSDDKPEQATAQELPEMKTLQDGDCITAVQGKPVGENDYPVVYEALQTAAGKPVGITVTNSKGISRAETLVAHFMPRFDQDTVSFAGLQMLPEIDTVLPMSLATGKLYPGDIVLGVRDAGPNGDQKRMPTVDQLSKFIKDAGENHNPIALKLLRNDKIVTVDIDPGKSASRKNFDMGISLGLAETDCTIADVAEGTPAKAAGIPAGAKLISMNTKPVDNWFDVNNIIRQLQPGEPVTVVASFDGRQNTYALKPTAEDIQLAGQNRLVSYAAEAMLPPATYVLGAPNLLAAAKMGIGETRDAILQVYQTVRSMAKGSISPDKISGPLGILSAGYRVAELGVTRLVWFLSIISANLAVMNFLPIPVVDGGLFTFLIIEKIKGSPISPRVQAAAQVAGLVILLSVFLFATYQDVYRLPLLMH